MIQPTGMFTLGNYLGALKNFVALQNDYECVYALADLHAYHRAPEPGGIPQKHAFRLRDDARARHRPGKEHFLIQSSGAGATHSLHGY